MVDSGKLSFGTVIDTSGFDEGVEAIEGKVGELGNSVEQETSNRKLTKSLVMWK